MQKKNVRKLMLTIRILMTFQLAHAQDLVVIHSRFIPKDDSTLVFTPSNYHPEKGVLSTVYLLHGYSAGFHQWNDIIRLQLLEDKYNFIVVCPDGFYNSSYLNSPLEKDHQYSSFFFQKKPVIEGDHGAAGEAIGWPLENPDKVFCIYAGKPDFKGYNVHD